MKTKYCSLLLLLLTAALLLCSCANAIDEEAGQPQSNGINKTPALTVPNPDAIDQIVPPASDDDTIASTPQLPQEEIPYEPIVPPSPEPFVPNPEIEPIEDFPAPRLVEEFLVFSSEQELMAFLESAPYFTKDSMAFLSLLAADIPEITEYYIPDPAEIPDGYQIVHVILSKDFIKYTYSNDPAYYDPDPVEGRPFLWPEETTLTVSFSLSPLPLNKTARLSGEVAKTMNPQRIVKTHHLGDNDHLIQ